MSVTPLPAPDLIPRELEARGHQQVLEAIIPANAGIHFLALREGGWMAAFKKVTDTFSARKRGKGVRHLLRDRGTHRRRYVTRYAGGRTFFVRRALPADPGLLTQCTSR